MTSSELGAYKAVLAAARTNFNAAASQWNTMAAQLNANASMLTDPAALFSSLNAVAANANAAGQKLRALIDAADAMVPVNPPTTGFQDFATRSSQPGVMRSFDFDTAAQLGGTYQSNFGRMAGRPVLDTNIKSSGASSIRFDVAAKTTDDTHAWFANFSPTLEQFGAGETFYVQWRQRWNQAFIDTLLFMSDGVNRTSVKQAIVGMGAVGTSDGGSSSYATSCSANELVVTSGPSVAGIKYPTMYHECGVSNGLYENPWHGDPGNFGLQNAMPAPYCQFSGLSGCFRWVANEWMTFKLRMSLGPIVGGKYTNSAVQFWGARDGQPSQLLVDWKPTTPGYFNLQASDPTAPGGIVEYGKIWFTPFMTDKSRTQDHPLLQTWYDDLIISRADIADAASESVTEPVPEPLPPPVGTPNPALLALADNTAIDIGMFPVPRLTDYSCMKYIGSQQCGIFGGGHTSSNWDAFLRLSLDKPLAEMKWQKDYLETPFASMTKDNYDLVLGAWKSGPSGPYPRAAARHTANASVVVGDKFIMLTSVEGNYMLPADWGVYTSYELANGDHKIPIYDLANKTFAFAASAINAVAWLGTALDPVSGLVIGLSTAGLFTYDPVTTILTRAIDFGDFPGVYQLRDEAGAVVQFGALGITQTLKYHPPTDVFYYLGSRGGVLKLLLNRVDLPKSTVTLLTTTGAKPNTPNSTGYSYDSVNDVFAGAVLGGNIYLFSPGSKAWTSQKILGGNVGSQAFACIDYCATNNVHTIITDEESGRRTWLYRHKRAV